MGLFDSEPHTDLTDPTGFLCGWKISQRLWAYSTPSLTQIPQIPQVFFVDGKSHRGCGLLWGEISRISVNEDKGMFFYFLLYNLLLISLVAVHYSVIAVFEIFFVEINQVAES